MVLINETHKYYLMRHRTERQDNTMTEITAKMFEEATGCIPINDDLERCNCPLAGDIGHSTCGWNKKQHATILYWTTV